jgi:ABC-2 type transport system ATP-binding protein
MIHVMDVLSDYPGNLGKIYSELPTLNDVFLEITGTELRDHA